MSAAVKMFVRILLFFFFVGANISSSDAQSFDEVIGAYYDASIQPHFQAYRNCALKHFRELGRTESRTFEEIEATVVKPCGNHISNARKAMARVGLTSRKQQNAIISTVYKNMVSDLKTAFLSGQKDAIRGTKQKELQTVWQNCVFEFAGRSAASLNEPAIIIVKGAFAYCQKQEDDLYQFLTRDGGLVADFVTTDLFPAMQKNLENKTIALILEIRSRPEKKTQPKTTQEQAL